MDRVTYKNKVNPQFTSAANHNNSRLNKPKGVTQKIADRSQQAYQFQRYSEVANGSSSTANTGLPEDLKIGLETLSGFAMDDVEVHYNSTKPTQLKAHAYAQGTNIHLAPNQEKHLPHEAWHVVQQKQGRVRPTTQLKGIAINDNQSLEKEADIMGQKATKTKQQVNTFKSSLSTSKTTQLQKIFFTNVNKEFKDKADLLINLLSQNNKILNYLGKRTAAITLKGSGTDTPASVRDTGKQVLIEIAPWYFEKYSMGHIVGMLCHEIGIHPMADHYGYDDLENKKDEFTVGTYGKKKEQLKVNPEKAGQSDHIFGSVRGQPRSQLYQSLVLEMARIIFNEANKKKSPVDMGEVTNLLDCYLMDVASILATNDHRLKGVFNKQLIAEIFNDYKGQLLADAKVAVPEIIKLFPVDKKSGDIGSDYFKLAGKVFGSFFKAKGKSVDDQSYQPNQTQTQYLTNNNRTLHWIRPDGRCIFGALGYVAGTSTEDAIARTRRSIQLQNRQVLGLIDNAANQLGQSRGDTIREIIKAMKANDWSNDRVGDYIIHIAAIALGVGVTILMPQGNTVNINGGGTLIIKVTNPLEHYHATD